MGSSVGKRRTPEGPPEIGKIDYKTGVIFKEGYILLETRQKNYEKRQFSIEILIKTNESFIEKLQNCLNFLCKRPGICT